MTANIRFPGTRYQCYIIHDIVPLTGDTVPLAGDTVPLAGPRVFTFTPEESVIHGVQANTLGPLKL